MNSRWNCLITLLVLITASTRGAWADSAENVDEILKKYELETKGSAKPTKRRQKATRRPQSVPAHEPAKTPMPEKPGLEKPVFDKSQFSLLKPTPIEHLREFDADRPGVTDSPKTIDAGHFQLESGLVGFTRHDPENKEWVFNSLFLNAGLTDSTELQLGWDSFVNTSKKTEDGTVSKGGAGDTTLRIKHNLIGNEEAPFSIGVIPYLVFPTRSHSEDAKKVEGGINLPFSFSLASEWSLGFMPAWAYKKNSADDAFHHEFSTGYVLAHPVFGPVTGFAQFLSSSSAEAGALWAAGSGLGFTVKVTPELQLDASSLWGMTPAQDNFQVSLGVAWRFH